MKKTFYKSKTASILILSSIVLIILLFVLWGVMRSQFNEQFKIIESKDDVVTKMNIILNMVETARSRTRLTHELILEDDYFIKDDISTELNILASRFAKKRQEFLSFTMSEFENNIIEQQNQIIKHILAQQRQVVEMIMDETVESNKKAQKMLFTDVTPGQGELVDLFMHLMNHYEGQITKNTGEARYQYQTYEMLQIYFLFTILVIVFFFNLWVTRRILSTEKELRQDKTLIHSTLMSLADAVIITDARGIVLDCNLVAENILQLPRQDIVSHSFTEVTSLTSRNNLLNFDNYLLDVFENNKNSSISDDVELTFEGTDEIVHLDLLLSPIIDENKKFGCIITFRDISDKKIMEKKIHHQANYDALTGLMNRYAFESKVNQLLKGLDSSLSHCLCVLDLDKFKVINDTCGHKAGDRVLKQITTVIQTCLRKGDTFARIGGDEFTVIFEDCPVVNAEKIMNLALDKISHYEFKDENASFTLGCSVGISVINYKTNDYQTAFKQADKACYYAKNNGRNRVDIYHENI